MKKSVYFNMLIFTIATLSMTTACSGNDSEESSEDVASYSSNDIVNILTGSWIIHGNCKCTDANGELHNTDFNGTLVFKSDLTVIANGPNIMSYSNGGITQTWSFGGFFGKNPYYTIIKKDGKTYLSIGSNSSKSSKDFQIQYLNKKSFKLVYDGDYSDMVYGGQGHIYLSIISD